MRFSFVFLIALVVLATFTHVAEAKSKFTKPVSLQGPNKIRVRCAVGHTDCKCWDCSRTHVLTCKYTC